MNAPRAALGSHRLPALDAARTLATLGIVWVHVSEVQGLAPRFSALGRFGTSFYIAAAVFMSALPWLKDRHASAAVVIRSRARRLLVPFALWSALYAAFYLVTMLPQGISLSRIASLWGPLAGTAPHLWFLPFAFTTGAVTAGLMPHLLTRSSAALAVLLVTVTSLSYLLLYGAVLQNLDHGYWASLGLVRLGRWLEEAPFAIASVLAVALYGVTSRQPGQFGPRAGQRVAYFCVLGLGLSQLAYFMFLEPLRHLVWTEVRIFAHVGGALWLAASIARRDGALAQLLAPLGRATYFAFLVHYLLLDLAKAWLARLHGHGTLWFAGATTLGLFATAMGLGLLVTRTRALRWLSP